MISSCLPFPCLTHRNKILYRRPRHAYRHHREPLYDIPDFAAQPLAAPIFVPPSPPPPGLDPPLPFIPLPRQEEPLEPLPLVHYRPRSPPPISVQPCQIVPYQELIPYPEPIVYRESIPYPEPILYPEFIPYREPTPDYINLHPYLSRMVNVYGNFIRPEELRAAVEVALDMILRELREPDYYRDRSLRHSSFRGIGLSDDRRLGDVELEEYVRRMNLVVQIANSHITTRMMHAEVHPKISDSGADAGSYPREFERPRRLEEFFVMDSSTLDRILQSYGLPRDGYSRDGLGIGFGRPTIAALDLRRGGLSSFGSDTERAREQKLRNLFEFLGVDIRDGLGSLGGGLASRDLLGVGRYGRGGLLEGSGSALLIMFNWAFSRLR